jgi:hypothetical protein
MIRAPDFVSKVTMQIDIDQLTESELIDPNHRPARDTSTLSTNA